MYIIKFYHYICHLITFIGNNIWVPILSVMIEWAFPML